MEIAKDTAYLHEIDLDRHAGLDKPDAPIPRPQLGESFELDDAILKGVLLVCSDTPSKAKIGL